MYLRGMGAVIVIGDKQYTEITPELGGELLSGKPVFVDGRPVVVQSFMGGFLINGCPLNVILGKGWIDGQQEALRAGGITQCLPVQQSTELPGGGAPKVVTPKLPTETIQPSGFLPLPSGPIGPPIDWGPEPATEQPESSGIGNQEMMVYGLLGLAAVMMLVTANRRR